MNGILYPLCAGVAWVSLLLKLPSLLRRDRGPAAIAIGLFYLFMGLTFTISDPRVWAVLDRATGVPNLALLLSQSSVICVSASQLAALTFWAHPDEKARPMVRRQMWGFAGVLAAMAVLFAMADLTEEDTTTAAVRFAGQGLYSVYLMLYVTSFAVSQFMLIARCRKHVRTIAGPWLRRGLRLAATGAVGGLVYVTARYADVLARPFGLDPLRWELAARLGAGLGGILTLIGWSVPGWGPQLTAARAQARAYRTHLALFPLWSALCTANPDLALDPGAGRRAIRDLDFQLHRRVVEIRDGIRWLRAYQDPTSTGSATQAAERAGLTGDDLRAYTEAAGIRAALTASARAGVPAAPERPASAGTESDTGPDWLVRVSRAFTTID
ncbi:MAB_1171c family putative transporter [Actinokineospora enzanensis]|uniref:MAB_1171c family putative transporter n=1 Tax=Actinokineospora enzanensis TaxID=155975 RepID=UPI000371EED5|nr:MAB_1171c family putative transporter [Actinokineospora enzanensis]